MSPDHQRAYRAECAAEYQEGCAANMAASVAGAPEEQPREARCSVATGSLPVSSAEAIIQKWAEQRNLAAHEKRRAPWQSGYYRAYKERERLISDMLSDMGRLAGLPIPRQPEENKV